MSVSQPATETPNYNSFLFRLARADESRPWRVQIYDVATGEDRHFVSLEACFDYIRCQFDRGSSAGGSSTSGRTAA